VVQTTTYMTFGRIICFIKANKLYSFRISRCFVSLQSKDCFSLFIQKCCMMAKG